MTIYNQVCPSCDWTDSTHWVGGTNQGQLATGLSVNFLRLLFATQSRCCPTRSTSSSSFSDLKSRSSLGLVAVPLGREDY
jgi:hypothetical protein